MSTLLEKIKSIKLCLMAHPDNEKDSEFEDRISDLEEIENELSKKPIKIETKKDLPQEKQLFRFIPCNRFDEEFIGWIDNEFDEVFFVDFQYYQIKKVGNSYLMRNNAWLTSQITHYMPI